MAVSGITYRRRVTYPETDASGIVHFTNFFKYMEEAEHALWRSAGLSIDIREGVSFPRVAASFDYKRPLKFEDEFDVQLRIVEKTGKTIRYAATLRKDDELIAEGSLTIICVRKKPGERMRATEIPPEISDRFEVAT
jgi:acyl-CoA thioester hydrolase